MIRCKSCDAIYCACQGLKCPECGSYYSSPANSPTKVTNLPFIKMHLDRQAGATPSP